TISCEYRQDVQHSILTYVSYNLETISSVFFGVLPQAFHHNARSTGSGWMCASSTMLGVRDVSPGSPDPRSCPAGRDLGSGEPGIGRKRTRLNSCQRCILYDAYRF